MRNPQDCCRPSRPDRRRRTHLYLRRPAAPAPGAGLPRGGHARGPGARRIPRQARAPLQRLPLGARLDALQRSRQCRRSAPAGRAWTRTPRPSASTSARAASRAGSASATSRPTSRPASAGGRDGEIVRAMREGVSRNGEALFPIMPWFMYQSLSDEDAAAVIAYLRAQPAVKSFRPDRELDFPLNIVFRFYPKPLDRPRGDAPAQRHRRLRPLPHQDRALRVLPHGARPRPARAAAGPALLRWRALRDGHADRSTRRTSPRTRPASAAGRRTSSLRASARTPRRSP